MAKGVIYNGINGIWSSLGCIPESGQSISIRVENSRNPNTLQPYPSLTRLLGFDQRKKDLGTLADSTRVSECVVLLPMIRKNTGWSPEAPYNIPTNDEVTGQSSAGNCLDCSDPCNTQADTVNDPKDNIVDNFIGFYESDIEDAYLFKIKEEIINDILSVPDYKKLSIFEIKEILLNKKNLNKQNPVVILMFRMVFYNFPPHLNWLLNKNIPPLVMYTFIFGHTFSQQDLSNIWQGTLPKIGTDPEFNNDQDQTFLYHKLEGGSFFDGYDIVNNDYDIKLRVFKIKFRARNDYEKEVRGVGKYDKPYKKDDQESLDSDPNWYESNWPYDFFSLVELVNITSLKYEEKAEE